MGLGTWLRSQTEFCIMAVKGSPVIDLSNQTTEIYFPLACMKTIHTLTDKDVAILKNHSTRNYDYHGVANA